MIFRIFYRDGNGGRKMIAEIRGGVRYKEPMSFHTSLRIGGPADIFILPQNVADIRQALLFASQEQLPVAMIGDGNNTLVLDRGIRGVVLKLGGCLGRAEFCGEEVMAGAGVGLTPLIREAASLNLGGMECLSGIPATIGGALATNAGTPDGSIGNFVSTVYFLHTDGGKLGEFKTGIGGLKFQDFNLPQGAIIIGCRLQLVRRPLAEIQQDIKQRLRRRKLAIPLDLASAGPIWKNPPGQEAKHLIEESGLKGQRVNGAEISAKNPDFVINRGNAKAADVLALMDVTRERIQVQFGITLGMEIKILGE